MYYHWLLLVAIPAVIAIPPPELLDEIKSASASGATTTSSSTAASATPSTPPVQQHMLPKNNGMMKAWKRPCPAPGLTCKIYGGSVPRDKATTIVKEFCNTLTNATNSAALTTGILVTSFDEEARLVRAPELLNLYDTVISLKWPKDKVHGVTKKECSSTFKQITDCKGKLQLIPGSNTIGGAFRLKKDDGLRVFTLRPASQRPTIPFRKNALLDRDLVEGVYPEDDCLVTI